MGAFGAIVAGLMANAKVPIGFAIVTLAGVLAGHMTYRLKRDLVTTTIVTVVVAFVGVWIGQTGAISSVVGWFNSLVGYTATIGDKEVKNILYMTPYGPMTWAVWIWGILALLFCYLGSVLPIWRFAQPVNYVSFWLVTAGIVGSIIGILFTWPGFGDFPAYTGFFAVGVLAPGVPTPLWPIIFVTIACGAI